MVSISFNPFGGRRPYRPSTLGFAITAVIIIIVVIAVATREKFGATKTAAGDINVDRLAKDIAAADDNGVIYVDFVRKHGWQISPLTFTRLINLRRENKFGRDDIVRELNN